MTERVQLQNIPSSDSQGAGGQDELIGSSNSHSDVVNMRKFGAMGYGRDSSQPVKT
jgi:hypothetical protein